MNYNRQQRCIALARELMPVHRTGRSFHVSFILNKNRILCYGINNYNKRHLEHRFGKYLPHKTGSGNYIVSNHSEAVAMRIFINKFGNNDCSGLTLFNVRVGFDGETLVAKPCINCQNNIVDKCNFKQVLWTE